MKEIDNKYILHFLPYEKFTMGIVRFFNTNYNADNNVFILYGNEKFLVGKIDELVSYGNVYKMAELSFKEIKIFICDARKIVLHCFNIYLAIRIFLVRRKNIYTVFWGGDLEILKKKNVKNFKGRIRILIAKIIFKYYIPINLIENDYRILTSELGYNFEKHYIAGYYTDLYEKQIVKLPYLEKNPIPKILLGNSATVTNNHREIIEILKKYNDKKMTIYIPLSYGDKTYANEVMMYANEVLKNEIIFLTDFIDPIDYNEFLNTIDIGIFNYHRQQGLGNITRLLLLQKKVYVNKKSGLYDYYKDQGIKIYDVELLKLETFNEFTNYDENSYNVNRSILTENVSNDKYVEAWDSVINDLGETF